MNNLKIFNSEEFGDIRTVMIDGEPWFVGKDIAVALGYESPRSVVPKKVDAEDRGVAEMETPSGKQEMTIINESGLYALIFGSKLESAKKFKHWVTSEVLPTLRKTGSYEMTKKHKQSTPKRPALSSVNMMVKNVMSTLEKAKVEPIFVAAEVKRLYTDLGYEVKAPLVTDNETMPKLYDCTEIAIELGIMSKSGLPHNQAVSDIIRKLQIKENEVKRTAFSRNGHDDVTVQYLPSVVDKVKAWLDENNYPTKIPYMDSKGNPKTRTVVYQEVADDQKAVY